MALNEPIVVTSPTTGEVLRTLPVMSATEIERACARARRAQVSWGALPFSRRADLLRAFVRRVRDDAHLVRILLSESGKTRYEAEAFEVLYLLEVTRYYTGRAGRKALADETSRLFLFPNKRARVTQHPHGVVGVIGPFNWPLLNNFADCIAPLVAGNAVLLKPSELTPLTSLRIQELWIEAGLPADVFQVIVGKASAGETLVSAADMLFFTGSERAGRAIAAKCAERLVPCVLELGGKSAMIVLEDADLERASSAALWSGFAHSGQICIRTERIYVVEAVYERFVKLCAKKLHALRQGPEGSEEEYDIGAMTHPASLSHLEGLLSDAVQKGAKVTRIEKTPETGRYFAATLVHDANDSMRIMHEESFGPLLPIMKVTDAEQAIELTNASPLGLSGSVWTRDAASGTAVAKRLRTGSVGVNDTLFNYLAVGAPLGGVFHSGMGFRHGAVGLRQFVRSETILEDQEILGLFSPFVARLFGFPYRTKILDLLRRAMKALY